VIGFFVKDTKMRFSLVNKVTPELYLFGKIGINLLERFGRWQWSNLTGRDIR